MSRMETACRYFHDPATANEERINEGIEKNRKGDVTISADLPEGATIEVEQLNHAFRFGANIFMLDEFESEEKNAIYREKFSEVFNIATLPFYWKDLEPEEGKPRFAADSPRIYRRPAPDLCLDYCREKGIEPKCHCLNYEFFTPQWAWKEDDEEFYAKLEKHMKDVAEQYADAIPSFEVINELFWSKLMYPREYLHAYDEDPDYASRSFAMAEKFFPNNKLIINECEYITPETFNVRTMYYALIDDLLKRGHRIDSIGFQYHGFVPRDGEANFAKVKYNPDVMFRVLDLYSRFNLPLQITEMTTPAYSGSEEDEEVQAELLRSSYRMFFSHPNMEAIIYWNVVDGYAAFGNLGDMSTGENTYWGGLLRFDMSEKPAWKMLKKLINEEWHTHETLSADNLSFRGFFGDYRVTVHTKAGDRTYTCKLEKGKENIWTLK